MDDFHFHAFSYLNSRFSLTPVLCLYLSYFAVSISLRCFYLTPLFQFGGKRKTSEYWREKQNWIYESLLNDEILLAIMFLFVIQLFASFCCRYYCTSIPTVMKKRKKKIKLCIFIIRLPTHMPNTDFPSFSLIHLFIRKFPKGKKRQHWNNVIHLRSYRTILSPNSEIFLYFILF